MPDIKNGKKRLQLLLIEDSEADAAYLEALLATDDEPRFMLTLAKDLAAGLKLLGEVIFDVCLLDLGLPDSQGMATFDRAHAAVPRVPIVILSGHAEEELVQEAVRRGAQDYLPKGRLEASLLYRVIHYAIERQKSHLALQQQMERLSLLNTITHGISTHWDLPSIYQVVVSHLVDKLPAGIAFATRQDAHGQWRMIAWMAGAPLRQSLPWLAVDAILPVTSNDACACFTTSAACLIEAPCECELFSALHGAGFGSMLCQPLRIGEAQTAERLLLVTARGPAHAFTADEVEFLGQLARHVGVACRQSLLHINLQRAYEELRETQQSMLQSERLRALGQMAAGITHDINNAITPIGGYADMLAAHEDLAPHLRRYADYIRTSVNDVAHIIAGMRDFYRPRDTRDAVTSMNLNALVRQSLDLARPRWHDMAQRQGITIAIVTELQPDLPPINGCEPELREAMMNLLFNAIDAMPDGGRIVLRTVCTAGQVSVAVVDQGEGMSEETRARCLEPFYTTKGEQGTGLGLATTYGIMQRHNGSIAIASEPGRGTTIELRFPQAASEPERPGTVVSKVQQPRSPLQVLCVEDEESIRELMQELLLLDGHQPVMANDGQSALALYQQAHEAGTPFDLVITDLGMPSLDGKQLATAIKALRPEQPIILLTGWDTRLHTENDLPGLVDRVLNKPVQLDTLRETIFEVAQSRSVPPETVS